MNIKKTAIYVLLFLLCILLLGKILQSISPNAGQQSYELHCAGCHGKDGQGLGLIVPPLAKADWVEKNQEKLACVIRYGMKEEVEVEVNGQKYNQEMLGLDYLSEIQITNIINYINSSWGNNYGFVKVSEIEAQLNECAPKKNK
jgi:mono/diheme cytochrome c family protein